MPMDLLRVDLVDAWEGVAGGKPVWIVRGTTVEEQPRVLKVLTINDLHASLCERAQKTNQLVWIGWRDGRAGSKLITTVKLDDSKFQAEEARSNLEIPR